MNKLKGIVSGIRSSGELSLVEIKVFEDILTAVVLDHTGIYFAKGKEVHILFKETEVALAVELSGKISLRNKLICRILAIEKGAILTSVKLDYNGLVITSIITTPSAELLALKTESTVTAFVKTNELMLMEDE
ncbi:MAG TPA: TOBE domain-containing protein [Cytophagales bacterium]|nr:TOBE domain-containing protein [Cytophagales bacterium]